MLRYCGHGHTAGDIVAWLPRQRVLVAGDLVQAQAALYTGDARTGPPPLSTVWQSSARRR
ncbi:MBL fold metallo-hydrolase [Micromonospora chersina]|uniref:MBL fold metallo-hydrolase n=1 Tax=Micromonospora chersina TaxID=47854 RepID=UPI0037ABCEE5